MILDDLKAFLIANTLATSTEIKFDFDSSSTNSVVLWNYGSEKMANGVLCPTIQIQVKNSTMATARSAIDRIFDGLCPKDEDDNRIGITLNGKYTHCVPKQAPFFNEQDDSGRFCYIFNITVTQGR